MQNFFPKTIDNKKFLWYNVITVRDKRGAKTMATVICYKQHEPTVYNRGTKYEKACDTFLAYYTYKTVAEAQKEVDEINANKPEKLFNGELAKCDERVYFVSEQEEMY